MQVGDDVFFIRGRIYHLSRIAGFTFSGCIKRPVLGVAWNFSI
jgi:hypothetical protein